ncbi:MAG: glycosyltransferase family 4 protein [Desulfobacterales bacterium]|jgi:glycosyltransferase involved in cell wall biosynthesis
MKVLFISDVPFANPGSGSEQMLNHQASGMAKLGLRVFAITRNSHRQRAGINKMNGIIEGSYCARPRDKLRFFFYLLKYPSKYYRRFIQNDPFQVVICHQPLIYCVLFIRKTLREIPLIYNFHSPGHEEYLLLNAHRSSLINFFPAGARRILERFCVKRAQKVMVESRYMEHKVRAIHRIAPDKIIVNPGGVDLERFRPSQKRNSIKAQLGLPKGKTHLLTVRNLEPRMGLDNLLKCVARLKKQQIAVHLTLGGDGPEKKNLKRLRSDLKLYEDVKMTGFIPPRVLPEYYAAADFFILPTRFLEGFGLVTPESMACGTPVLGTPVGATKEILARFDSDFLFRDASAEAMALGIGSTIQRYAKNPRAYSALRRQCREFAQEHYSWDRHLKQLSALILPSG